MLSWFHWKDIQENLVFTRGTNEFILNQSWSKTRFIWHQTNRQFLRRHFFLWPLPFNTSDPQVNNSPQLEQVAMARQSSTQRLQNPSPTLHLRVLFIISHHKIVPTPHLHPIHRKLLERAVLHIHPSFTKQALWLQYIYIYLYICREREREKERPNGKQVSEISLPRQWYHIYWKKCQHTHG